MLSLLAAAAQHAPMHWSDLGLRPGIDLHFFTLRYYSLAYIAGIVLGYWHLTRMVKAPGAPMAPKHAEDLFFYCTLGIILGGRIGYGLFYTGWGTGVPSMFFHFTPAAGRWISWDFLRLWDGGMSFHGGVLGVLVAIAWVSWRGKLNWLRVCDYIAVNVPFGMFFGRLANFINGELWGREAGANVPWAMTFCDIEHSVDRCVTSGMVRHPSQLYEALLEGLLLAAILLPVFWKTRARYRPGLMVGLFTLLIALARFVVEFYREPDQQLEAFAHSTGLSMGQWLTIPLMIVGVAVMVRALMKPPLASGRPA